MGRDHQSAQVGGAIGADCAPAAANDDGRHHGETGGDHQRPDAHGPAADQAGEAAAAAAGAQRLQLRMRQQQLHPLESQFGIQDGRQPQHQLPSAADAAGQRAWFIARRHQQQRPGVDGRAQDAAAPLPPHH